MLPKTYLTRLAEIHGRRRPRAYLEIGVCAGRSLALAGADTNAFGVDPDPQVTETLGSGTSIFRDTSDRIFGDPGIVRELARHPLDLVFIDGLHLFEAALRDFLNAARYCAPDARIVFHDTLPHDAQMALRNRETQAWTGDVWKAVLALKRLRPYLEITTLDTPPTGLTIVGNIDPADRFDAEEVEVVARELMELGFRDFHSLGMAALNVVPDSVAAMERLVPQSA
ncbi:MAG: class I SAM-dependent methyltransferase [Thermoanaerobaculia bacterium]